MAKKSRKIGENSFSGRLLTWNKEENDRQMPWKGEKDPYRIWLSEIILQQTRVEQGLKYYTNFLSTFPTVTQLAKAPPEKVFKLWEGLGYYSRCRNLIATAQKIAFEYKGKFPDTYDTIKELKGIGPYTAAAISSFAFNLPHAVVDGNVFRVLSRIFGIDKPIDSTEGKKYFTTLANELLDREQPGLYNQAIMDFGATICKPSPVCDKCVFNKDCYALLNDAIDDLPVKEKKIRIRKRWFYYLVIRHKNKIAIRQRTGKDIWQHLHEFALIEASQETDNKKIMGQAEKEGLLKSNTIETVEISPSFRQQLSHQLITGQFITLDVKTKPALGKGWIWADQERLGDYAFPQFINQYLRQ